MRRFALSLLFLLIGASAALAAPKFPELTGRVVDDAHVLSPRTVQYLSSQLADYEAGTTNQIVVLTLPWLLNDTLENYSNLLFRHWGLGQKGKDNGVLIVIVTSEKRVRIEVGDRLEPVLTDVVSSQIINDVMVPALKDVDYDRAVVGGTQAIIGVLGGHPVSTGYHQAEQQPASAVQTILSFVFLIFFLIFAARHPFLAMWFLSNARFGSSGGSDWGGGDNFRGGGGTASGGGASGSW